MLRPNTELLKEEVSQSLPRFVDVSKGTLTAKTKRSEAVNIEFMLKNHKENLKKGTMENYQLFDR